MSLSSVFLEYFKVCDACETISCLGKKCQRFTLEENFNLDIST